MLCFIISIVIIFSIIIILSPTLRGTEGLEDTWGDEKGMARTGGRGRALAAEREHTREQIEGAQWRKPVRITQNTRQAQINAA